MKVTEPTTSEEFDKYYQLRWEVLRKPWDQPIGSEKDEHEESSVHAVIFDEKKNVIAVCRMQMNSATEAQLRFMGVRDDQQGKGLGKLLLSYLEKIAKEKGATKIILQSREIAVDFYKRNGYMMKEKSFLMWGLIQHYLMEKKL